MTAVLGNPEANLNLEPADAPSFNELYAAHLGRVRWYVARRLSDPDTVDDVVQETFVRVYRFSHRLDPTLPAWPWIKAIASTMCNNAVRGKAYSESVVADFESDPELAARLARAGRASCPEAEVISMDCRRELTEVLGSLSKTHREVLIRKDLLGLTAAEIAAHDGMSPDAVKSLVVRARIAFRRSWDGAGHGRLSVAFLPWVRRLRGCSRLAVMTAAGPGVIGEALACAIATIVITMVNIGSPGASAAPILRAVPVQIPSAPTSNSMARTTSGAEPAAALPHPIIPGNDLSAPPRPPRVKELEQRSFTAVVATPITGAEGGVSRGGDGDASDDPLIVDDRIEIDPGPAQPVTGGSITVTCDGEVRRAVCGASDLALAQPSKR